MRFPIEVYEANLALGTMRRPVKLRTAEDLTAHLAKFPTSRYASFWELVGIDAKGTRHTLAKGGR